MALHEGDPEVLGEYRVVDRLGIGGMGVVYRARSRSGREAAVKVVHAQYAADPVFRARFRQEIAAVRKVSGAFTAPVVDADPEADRPWMATQYVPGRSLSAHIRDDGPLAPRELRRLALGLVEALRDIHRAGVVHRDLKPGNVLMADDGPRVIDFGISRAAENQTLTETGHMMGTPPFMSPEQLMDARSVGPASDIFSLGALLAFAATGRGPFDAGSPYMTAYQVMREEPVLDAVPPPLRDVVLRCLAKEQAARPGLDELSHSFAEALTDPDPDDTPTLPHRRPDPAPTALPSSVPVVAAHETPEAPDLPEPPRPVSARANGRRLPVIAGVAGLLVTVLLAYFLGPLKGGASGEGASPSPSATRWSALPADWRPWHTSVFATAAHGVRHPPATGSDTGGSGPNPSCVLGGGSLYCVGNGALPVRVDAATGRAVWRAAALPAGTTVDRYGALALGVRGGALLVHEHVMNAAANDTASAVVAYATADGRRLWSHPTEDRYADAVVLGDLVLTPEGTVVTARSARSGAMRWRTALPAGHHCAFLADRDRAYADCVDYHTASGAGRLLLALDPADGSTRRLRSAPPVTAVYTGAAGGRLVFTAPGTNDPTAVEAAYTRIVSVDPVGDTVRTARLAEEQRGHIALVHGVLCFAGTNGRVTAFSALTGAHLWRTATTLEQPGVPVADAGGSVFVASASGRVAALDARAGTLLWESYPRADRIGSVAGPAPGPLFHEGALVGWSPDGTLFTLDPAHPERRSVSG
ncbi:protein kinase [Streptomyces sp. NPDC006476]|uniref:protein kinase domain-containing protein n=1 Tax=Streptomyces sp. NPDC006476 TaxID=3157175 RepID=UPI0033B01291